MWIGLGIWPRASPFRRCIESGRASRCVQAIILAAGAGRRMAPLTTRILKPMLPLAGVPLLVRQIGWLRDAGCDEVVVLLPPGREAPAVDGVHVVARHQKDPDGTGGAVAAAADGGDDDVVLMGDAVLDAASVRALVDAEGPAAVVHDVPERAGLGAVEVRAGHVVAIEEKARDGPGAVWTGACRLTADAVRRCTELPASSRGERELTDVLAPLKPKAIVANHWFETGTPWAYLEAHEQMMGRLFPGDGPGVIEPGVHVHGRLHVAHGACVRSGTYIEGDVIVGPGADVGPNAFLRGAVDVGAGCRIGAGTEIKNSILLAGAKAPHQNYVGDSILGHDANLGAGARIANLKLNGRAVGVRWDGTMVDTRRRKFGAVVGDGAAIGINAGLQPGTVVGPGRRIGAGRVVSGWVDEDCW